MEGDLNSRKGGEGGTAGGLVGESHATLGVAAEESVEAITIDFKQC
ncbi:MAG: hypothetical protein ACKO2V_07950 [Snowella sp.]